MGENLFKEIWARGSIRGGKGSFEMMGRQKEVIRIQMNSNSSELEGRGVVLLGRKNGNMNTICKLPTGKTENGGLG